MQIYANLKGCRDVQRFSFDTGLQWFKCAVLVTDHNPLTMDASKTYLDDLAVNGGVEEVPSINFGCLNGQYPVLLKAIDLFR